MRVPCGTICLLSCSILFDFHQTLNTPWKRIAFMSVFCHICCVKGGKKKNFCSKQNLRKEPAFQGHNKEAGLSGKGMGFGTG